MRVEVYRNLHTGTWSVRGLEGAMKGKVFSHPNFVYLTNATFVVQPAGNAKVRAEGRKNVHAFVRGELKFSSENALGKGETPDDGAYKKAKYNPYEHTSFVDNMTGKSLDRADRVILDITSGVWYADGVV
jgi:hypothetical protein